MEHNHNWHTRTPETHGSFHLYCVKWIFVCAHTICWLSLLIFTFFFIFGCCCCCCWRWCDSFALSLLDKQTNKREWTKTDKLVTGQQKSVSCACSQAKRVNTRTRAYDIRLRDACIIIRVRSECVMTAYAMWACVRASVRASERAIVKIMYDRLQWNQSPPPLRSQFSKSPHIPYNHRNYGHVRVRVRVRAHI